MLRLHVSALGALTLAFIAAGCGGSFTPSGAVQTTAALARPGTVASARGACSPATNGASFDAAPIAKGSYVWFTSVVSAPNAQRAVRVDMMNSIITLRDGKTTYRILGPNMRLSITSKHEVRLHFKAFRDHWRLEAPFGTAGDDFLNATAYQFEHGLPGGISNVVWSAKFFGQNDEKIRWKWSARVYTAFTDKYRQLNVKAIDDRHYPPYNTDPAGTPESYKAYVTRGATEGVFGSPVEVTPCSN